MTNVEFHLQLNHNVTWNMSRLHFHDHYELLLPLTSPGNIFVNDQVYPLQPGHLVPHRGEHPPPHHRYRLPRPVCPPYRPEGPCRAVHPPDRPDPADPRQLPPCRPVHRRDDRDHRAVSGPGAQQKRRLLRQRHPPDHCPAQPADPRRPCPQRLHRRRGHPQQGLSAGGAHPGLYPGQPG